MKLTTKKDERESGGERCITSSSTKRGTMTKRLLLLVLVTMSLVFAGTQSVPTTQASVGCELVCGAPYIGADGQCYVDCCPTDPTCMNACERLVCK